MFYEAYDPDNSGLDFRELNKVLRPRRAPAPSTTRSPRRRRRDRRRLEEQARAPPGGTSRRLRRRKGDGDGAGPRHRPPRRRRRRSDLKSVTATLREAMQKNQQKVISLFTSWDADGNGSVSRGEFGMALEMLGLEAPREAIAALFDEFDADKSGTVEFAELNAQLRKRAATLPEELQPGSVNSDRARQQDRDPKGESARRRPAARQRLRRGWRGRRRRVGAEQRAALTKNWARVKDLFLSWDTNNDGVVSRDEFARRSRRSASTCRRRPSTAFSPSTSTTRAKSSSKR